MQTATKWALGVICGSILAAPFTEPLNWWIGSYLDAHPDVLATAVGRGLRVIESIATYIPPGLFLGVAAGAGVVFLLLRGRPPAAPAPAAAAPALDAPIPTAPAAPAAAGTGAAPRADPFTRTYKDQVVRLPDLIVDAHYILRGKQFENCVIHGPAVIHLFEGMALLDCGWNCGDDVEEMFIRVKGASMHNGLIGLAECTFLHCSFRDISIIGTDDYCDLYKKELFGL